MFRQFWSGTARPVSSSEWVAGPFVLTLLEHLVVSGIPEQSLLAGTGLDRAGIRAAGRWIEWDVFARLLANAGQTCTAEALITLGARAITKHHVLSLPPSVRRWLGPADVYWVLGGMARVGLRQILPCLELRAWEVAPQRFTFELSLPPACQPPPELWSLARGALSAIPVTLGLPRASVDLEMGHVDGNALFHVELPAPASWITRSRWMPRRFRNLRIAVEELEAAHDLLNQQYEELRRTQVTLRDSEARFRALIENSSDFILLADVSGVVTYLSPSAERITGWPASEAVGRLHAELAHEDDRQNVTGLIERLMGAPGATGTLRVRFRTQKGSWIWLEGTARNMLEDVRVGAVLVNYRDVSDRIRLEEELLQSRKMESIGRLAGGLAHDFNNLLTGVLANAEIVLLRLGADSPLRPPLEHIIEYSNRGAELTSQLLSFARKQMVQPRAVDLNELVPRTLGLLERLIGMHIEIVTHLVPGVATVEIDPAQFQQVIVNLATNARDAMQSGGTLTLSTTHLTLPEVESAEDGTREYVALMVTDTGTGMDEDTRSKVFEPFFTTKELGYGTGLGLSTCHGIVTQAGGRIDVISHPGVGTTFRVCLPRVDTAPSPAARAQEPRALRSGTETLLLVDDDPAVLRSTAELLRWLGYTVLTAASGGEALAIVDRHTGELHAVISDIVMPKISGPQLVERLTELRPTIKALFTSGYGGHRQSFELRDGAPFLRKPFELSSLAAALHTLLHPE
jgi:PAS domain S-box-containing protein